MSEHLPSPTISPEVLESFRALFFPRQDIHARQKPSGEGYSYRKEPVTLTLLSQHFAGEVTLGTYCLSVASMANFTAIDIDDAALWQAAADNVKVAALPVHIEQSRRGVHLWHFFEQPISGKQAQAVGRALLAMYQLPEKTEIYPRQATLADGPGSLIRVPFGFHRKVQVPGKPGKRFGFQTLEGEPLAPIIREQLALIAFAERMPQALVEQLSATVPEQPTFLPSEPFHTRPVSPGLPLSERLRARISVVDFVSRYVELNERGIGFCPFHDDEHMSFGVNTARNYWSCFAGCSSVIEGKTIRGGSVIHFWQRWREKEGQDGGFEPTMLELAHLLGL
ncbi:MAG: CHC2 zinc finger domain-containing protein [Chloroflexota bacterium]